MRGLAIETEKALTRTLDKATDFIESGDHPTAAFIKASQECDLTPGHARLAAVAYNTGRAAFQRDASQDVHAKIAEFDLADPELVAAEIGRTKKTAAAVPSAGVSSQYSNPPTFLREHYKQAVAAIEIPSLNATPVGPLPRAATTDGINACSSVRNTQRKIADLRSVTDKMLRVLDSQIDAIGRDFRITGGPAILTLKKAAEIRRDVGVLGIINELVRRDELLLKQAASKSPVLSEMSQRIYAKLAAAAATAVEFIVANKKLAAATEQAGVRIASTLAPFMRETSAVQDPFFELNAGASVKTASVVQKVMMPFTGAAAGAYEGKTRDENVRNYQMALEDPGHDQTLRGLRARTTLETLRATDPVLSGYSQAELVGAFNQIAGGAPSMASQPLYMSAMMRRYLGQGNALDADDVRANVLALENDTNKNRMIETPKLPEVSRRPETAEKDSGVVYGFNKGRNIFTPPPEATPAKPDKTASEQIGSQLASLAILTARTQLNKTAGLSDFAGGVKDNIIAGIVSGDPRYTAGAGAVGLGGLSAIRESLRPKAKRNWNNTLTAAGLGGIMGGSVPLIAGGLGHAGAFTEDTGPAIVPAALGLRPSLSVNGARQDIRRIGEAVSNIGRRGRDAIDSGGIGSAAARGLDATGVGGIGSAAARGLDAIGVGGIGSAAARGLDAIGVGNNNGGQVPAQHGTIDFSAMGGF
jgi:hypothetical protein